MFVGILEADLLLGDIHSLKEKRSVIRPLIAEIQRKWPVAAAEAGNASLHRRALIGVAVVAGDAGHCVGVLDSIERLIAARPEIELLSVKRRYVGPDE